jgi:nucleotide-binding universal stress UspA family protein
MSFSKILVPLDGSKLAEAALAPAQAFAEAQSADVVLLRVVVPLAIKFDPDLYQRVIDDGQKVARTYLDSIQARSQFFSVRLKGDIVVGKAAKSA